MGEVTISRRSLLLAGAGAVAGAALGPAASLAARPSEGVGTIELGTVGSRPLAVALPAGVGVVGLERADGPLEAAPMLRVRLRDGAWGPWTRAAAEGHGPEAATDMLRPAGRSNRTSEPLWVGGARELQLRSAAPLSGLRLRYVVDGTSRGDARAATAGALPLAQPILDAGAGQPSIIARSAWAQGTQLPRVAPAYGKVELGFVHHTENPNGYGPGDVPAMLRSIYVFHRDVNGWNDIGYNFVIDLFGRVWEARAGGIDEAVVGAHAGGYNLYSTGVAVLGSFMSTPISAAARRTLQLLLAWKLALHGAPSQGKVVVRVNPAGASYSKYPARARVSLPRIAGHRDADSTDCPGDVLYGELPGVRRAVAGLSGQPVVAAIALQAAAPSTPAPATGAPSGEPAPVPTPVPNVVVTLTSLAGAPLPGLHVTLQARTVARRGELVTRTTVAEGATDAEGRLLLPATFAQGAPKPLWVRALYAGGQGLGAAVSQAVRIEPIAAPVTPSPPASAPSG